MGKGEGLRVGEKGKVKGRVRLRVGKGEGLMVRKG